MSKIFNWFFGSFFRTLGRVLVFMLLGYILFSFLNLNDIKLPDIFGVLNVSADVDLSSPSFFSQTIFFGNGSNEQTFTTFDTELFNGRPYLYNTKLATITNITGSFWKFDIDNQGVFNRIEFKTYTRGAQPTSAIIRIQGTNDKTNFSYLTDELTCNISNNINESTSSAYIYSYYCDIPKIDYTYNHYRLFIYVNGAFTRPNSQDLDIQVYYGINRWLTLYNKDNNSTINESIKDQTEQQHQDSVNTQDKIDNANEKLDGINSTITDSSSPNIDGLNDTAGWLPQGPIDGILNLPLTFLNSLNTNLTKTCNPVELPLPFVDKTLTLPCVNSLYSQIKGLPVWINTISIIASGFILFRYLINLYQWVDDTLTFRENNFLDNWSGV